MSRLAIFKRNAIPSTVSGTVYTHFVYTVPHIARVAYFKGNAIPTTVRGTVYTHFVYTVPHIARVAYIMPYLLQLEEREHYS